MNFPWIGCVFLLLHSLVLLMKQHSYAFYNGYLWDTTENLHKVEGKIKKRQGTGRDDGNLEELRVFLKEELDAQSTAQPFPANITFANYFAYSMFPTLVYQIEFPRNKHISWAYVGEKLAATFGVFMLMIVLADNFLFPIAMRAMAMRDTPLYDRILAYPSLLMDMVMP